MGRITKKNLLELLVECLRFNRLVVEEDGVVKVSVD